MDGFPIERTTTERTAVETLRRGTASCTAECVAISFSSTPMVVLNAGQSTAHVQPLAPSLLVSLTWHSLADTSETTSTSPL